MNNDGHLDYIPLCWQGKPEEPEHIQTLLVNPYQICALISLLYLFGKRISENLKLRRKHLSTKRGYLYVTFPLLKKKRLVKGENRILKPLTSRHRVSIENSKPFSTIIIGWTKKIEHLESWVFAGNSRPHVQVVKNKKYGKTYKYVHTDSGRMSRTTAYRVLKALNPSFFPHFFRKSLATHLAEDPKVGPIAMQQWFDWDKIETATNYILKTERMTQRIQDRVPI